MTACPDRYLSPVEEEPVHHPTRERFAAACGHIPPVQVECSWCGIVLREGREPVSHGICERCTEEHFPETSD